MAVKLRFATIESGVRINMGKLYHRVPTPFEGRILYPLNQLKDIYPELAILHARKYEGRDDVMLREIPGRSWLWNDVLHLSPVHPKHVIEALVESGFNKKVTSRWFVVDPIALGFTAENSITFLHNRHMTSGEIFDQADFEDFSEENISLYSGVPDITKEYFKTSISNGINPLMFGGIPHILHHGSLPIAELEVIEIQG